MSSSMYSLCCKYHGKHVRLTCHDGRVHIGKITRVTREHVWLQPIGHHGGFGYGYYGYGRRFGFGIPFALGAIAGVALASAFFW
jgi:hypothetical protein